MLKLKPNPLTRTLLFDRLRGGLCSAGLCPGERGKTARRIVLCSACLCGRVKDTGQLPCHWTGMESIFPSSPSKLRPKKIEPERLNWGFGSATSPWALCSCLSALFPRHKTGQCAFAQLHPVFIGGRAGLGRGCRAWIGSTPSCPLGQPRLLLGQEKHSQHHRPPTPVLF